MDKDVVRGVAIAAGLAGIALIVMKASGSTLPPPEEGYANLSGKVTSGGNPLSDVLVDIGTSQTMTDESGDYAFLDIVPGYYTVTFSKVGYQTEVYSAMWIKEGNNVVNVPMTQIVVPAFTYSNLSYDTGIDPASSYMWITLNFTIHNLTPNEITHTITVWRDRYNPLSNLNQVIYNDEEYLYPYSAQYSQSVITIPAGGYYLYYFEGRYRHELFTTEIWHVINILSSTEYDYFWLQDELGNQSPKIGPVSK